MKFDEVSKTIKISVREFVSIARRGISVTLPCDEKEPVLGRVSERILKKNLSDAKSERLIYSFECEGNLFELVIHSDKIDSEKNEVWFVNEVSDVKTEKSKEYNAQQRGEAFIGAFIYCQISGKSSVKLHTATINRESGEFSDKTESAGIKKLERFFNKCLDMVKIYAKPETDRVTKRLPTMRSLKFPYKNIREGQKEFVRKAYNTIARGGVLFATAPTGTGKTISALYPAIKAMGDGRRDKTFYLTPKETTAIAVKECLLLLANEGAVVRAVQIYAKEKQCKRGLICREKKKLCEASECNNLKDAVLALYSKEKTVVDSEDIEAVAKERNVCPYELSLSYAELCDVVICDFNYLFNPDVYIRRFFNEGGNYTFLVDEAHNLPDRAREMYSAQISTEELNAPSLNEFLGAFSETKAEAKTISDSFYDVLYPYLKEDIRDDSDGNKISSVHLSEIPDRLYAIFEKAIGIVEKEILQNYSAKDEEKELRIKILYSYLYTLKKFYSVMLSFNGAYEMFVFYQNGSIRAKLFCIDTGGEIAKRLSKGEAAIFFSATLTPTYYYKSLLGGDGTADMLEVNSPFDKSQLSVSIMDKISTRFSEREDTLHAVIRAIAATVSAKRGNYMIFSPSFAYSDALAKLFQAKYPKIKTLVQKKNMSPKEKEGFLNEFTEKNSSYLVAFCVMGGVYSEGIDLAGDSLIGAVIVGIGLPGLSYEREAIAAYYDEKYEEGKQFSYIYPGINRVLQAAGRVIRREDDKGVIVLIDDRFDDPIYKKIVPKLWSGMKYIDDPKALQANLQKFWNNEKD